MAVLARTPVLPEATPIGTLSALLRHSSRPTPMPALGPKGDIRADAATVRCDPIGEHSVSRANSCSPPCKEGEACWKTEATLGLKTLGDKQSDDMTRSLGISDRTAQAAEDAANVANRSLIEMERPYIFISISPYVNTKIYWVHYKIENYGRTPALVEEVTHSVCLAEIGD